MALDTNLIFWARYSVRCCDDFVGGDVQKSGLIEYRYSALYQLALFTLGYQTFVVSVDRYISYQAIVDMGDAAIYWSITSTGSFERTG